jgi:hypothetical protein
LRKSEVGFERIHSDEISRMQNNIVLAFAHVRHESTPYNNSQRIYNSHAKNCSNHKAQAIKNIENSAKNSGYLDMPQLKIVDDSFKVDNVYANTKKLIRKVEDVYQRLNLPALKRDRLYYHFF